VPDHELAESAVVRGEAIQFRNLTPFVFKQAHHAFCVSVGDDPVVTVVPLLERVVQSPPTEHVLVIVFQKNAWGVVTRSWCEGGLSSGCCGQQNQHGGSEHYLHVDRDAARPEQEGTETRACLPIFPDPLWHAEPGLIFPEISKNLGPNDRKTKIRNPYRKGRNGRKRYSATTIAAEEHK
jgi:hypothetical protein